MRQPSEDRALYYRQLRETVRDVFLPELTSATAVDAAGLVDRILAQFIIEAEHCDAFEVDLHGPDAEREWLERVDGWRVDVFGEATANGSSSLVTCSVTQEQLKRYLRSRLVASPDVVVEQLTLVPGGRSKETILVSLSGTTELPSEVILRKDRPVGVLQTRAADEFAVMAAIHAYGGVPIPEPFFADEDDSLGDGTFEVMARVAGSKAGEYFPDLAAPTEHGAAIARQLAVALARLHSMPLDRLASTRLDASATVTEESIVGAVDTIARRIDELSGPSYANVPVARQWLLDHVTDAVAADRVCLLQGDFGLHNVLIDGATVTALVDWEAAAIGPPARELAAAWNLATSLSTWDDFVGAYADAGGPADAIDRSAVNYYRVLSALGAFMTSRMGGHLFRTGAKRDLVTAHSGLDSHFRCARNLARALHDAMHASDARTAPR